MNAIKPPRWIPTTEINAPAFERKATFTAYLSPYDMPLAVRGFRDTTKDEFVIEFQYPTAAEPVTEISKPNLPLRFNVGCNSGRIYAIMVPAEEVLKALTTTPVEQGLNDFLRNNYRCQDASLEQRPDRNRIQEHYDLTRRILLGNRDALFQYQPGPGHSQEQTSD